MNGPESLETQRLTWDKEYSSTQAIPSSTRQSPSGVLTAILNDAGILTEIETAVEVGCGNGRNTDYIAEEDVSNVYGVDFSEAALARASENVRDPAVSLLRGNVVEKLPFSDSTVDLVVDSYVSCHFVSESNFESYLSEVERVATSGGFLYWAGIGVGDEYYSQFTDGRLVTDPLNDVTKRLFTLDEVEEAFGHEYETHAAREISFMDTVDSVNYERSILTGLYRL